MGGWTRGGGQRGGQHGAADRHAPAAKSLGTGAWVRPRAPTRRSPPRPCWARWGTGRRPLRCGPCGVRARVLRLGGTRSRWAVGVARDRAVCGRALGAPRAPCGRTRCAAVQGNDHPRRHAQRGALVDHHGAGARGASGGERAGAGVRAEAAVWWLKLFFDVCPRNHQANGRCGTLLSGRCAKTRGTAVTDSAGCSEVEGTPWWWFAKYAPVLEGVLGVCLTGRRDQPWSFFPLRMRPPVIQRRGVLRSSCCVRPSDSVETEALRCTTRVPHGVSSS